MVNSKIKVGDKVSYQGMKWTVSFVHSFESLLTKYEMYDLRGKRRFCCVINMGDIKRIKRRKK